MSQYILRPSVRVGAPPEGMFTSSEYEAVASFYRDEVSTPLHSLPFMGVRELMVKDESARHGLNAFKTLGVSFAVDRLRVEGRIAEDTVLACATDGNHGRAVARAAARLQLKAHIYLPAAASEKRIAAIKSEGARVHIVGGNYDDAVRQAAEQSERNGWLVVSDTSWPGYDEIPRWIMLGYTQLLAEACQQWTHPPDAVFVQAGVGGLACAVASWFAHTFGRWRPFLICCQAAKSACVFEAARAGHPVPLQGDLETVMDCLSAGEVSHTAWPVLDSTVDAFVKVEDEEAIAAVEMLREYGIAAGYSGACGMAAFVSAMRDEGLRAAAGLDETSRVLMIVSEGASS